MLYVYIYLVMNHIRYFRVGVKSLILGITVQACHWGNFRLTSAGDQLMPRSMRIDRPYNFTQPNVTAAAVLGACDLIKFPN